MYISVYIHACVCGVCVCVFGFTIRPLLGTIASLHTFVSFHVHFLYTYISYLCPRLDCKPTAFIIMYIYTMFLLSCAGVASLCLADLLYYTYEKLCSLVHCMMYVHVVFVQALVNMQCSKAVNYGVMRSEGWVPGAGYTRACTRVNAYVYYISRLL